jgi:hypothetical protein
MGSLLDIAPVTKTVEIRGTEIAVSGLTAADFAVLLTEHPNIRAVLDGALSKGGGKFDAKHLLTEMPMAAAEVIARGVADKSAGHKALLASAKAMMAYDQARLLSAIFEVTMPDGIGPFADAVVSLLAGNWGKPMDSKKEEEEKLPLEVLSPQSPPRLSASVVMDAQPKRRGDLRRAS